MVKGLQFNDAYTVTVTETPASDADADPTPPAPVSGVVLTTTCSHSNGTPVADPSDLRYSILEGDPTLFSIGESSGEFSVADQPFDYEEQPWYLVHLLCYLDSDPSSNGTGTVNVTIGPVNEYLPEITPSTITIALLREDDPVGKVVAALAPRNASFTYSATDRDDGPDGRILFDLTQGDSFQNQQVFDLDPDTGTLTLTRALDVDGLPGDETFDRLDISITACNEGIPVSICNNIALTVFITAADDNDPQFLRSQYRASVLESALNGTLVVQANCVDEDKGIGSTEGIAFGSGTPNSVLETFEVNSTGAVLLKGELDYRNTTGYQFQLVCSDGDTTATTQVTVTVLPLNDNDPQFLQSEYTARLPETAAIGTLVVQVKCEDQDIVTGNNENMTFDNRTSNSVLAVFELRLTVEVVDKTLLGAVFLKGGLDYENTTGYQFRLVCSDRDTTATTQVTVTVLPVNDNPPHFMITEDRYEFSVERISPTGHTVGQVEATDEDVGTGNDITYSIETNSNFAINAETGEITVEDYVLAIEGSSFDMKVYASDGELSVNATVHIRVTGPLTILEIAVVSASVVLQLILMAIVICCCCYCCIWKSKLRYEHAFAHSLHACSCTCKAGCLLVAIACMGGRALTAKVRDPQFNPGWLPVFHSSLKIFPSLSSCICLAIYMPTIRHSITICNWHNYSLM